MWIQREFKGLCFWTFFWANNMQKKRTHFNYDKEVYKKKCTAFTRKRLMVWGYLWVRNCCVHWFRSLKSIPWSGITGFELCPNSTVNKTQLSLGLMNDYLVCKCTIFEMLTHCAPHFTSFLPVCRLFTRRWNQVAGICVHSTARALLLVKSSADVVGEAWLTVGIPAYSRGAGWGWGQRACEGFPRQTGKAISLHGAGFVQGSIVINRKLFPQSWKNTIVQQYHCVVQH